MSLLVIDGEVTDTAPRLAWAVGPEGGFGWIPVWAPTEDAACDIWLAADTAGLVDPDTLVAARVEQWDDLDRDPGTADWIAAGFAVRCAKCAENVETENLGCIVDEVTVLCSNCLRQS